MVDFKELELECQRAFQKAVSARTVKACMDWERLEDEYAIQCRLREIVEPIRDKSASSICDTDGLLPKEKG